MKYVPMVEMPLVAKVEQTFPRPVCNYVEIIQNRFSRYSSEGLLKAGQKIAIAVGSRGIASLPIVVKTIVDDLKKINCEPYIVPAMGSHGGATADGQLHVLNGYGISEESMGVPIISSMDVDVIGEYQGEPVYFDRFARSCDGIIAVNRVKPHTDFHGKIESGICKILTIGMGKHKGAVSIHGFGAYRFPEVLPDLTALLVSKLPMIIGVSIVENAYHDIAHLEVVGGMEICAMEEGLLKMAYDLMPKLPFEELDVLVVNEIGKDVSGTGMDPNITGRNYFPWVIGGPKIEKIVILDLTTGSDGNPLGMGVADVITQRILDKSDIGKMYTNCMASKGLWGCKIPFTAPDDQEAISVALHCIVGKSLSEVRAVRIRNTLELTRFEASLPLIRENQSDRLKVISEPYRWTFDPNGYLTKSG